MCVYREYGKLELQISQKEIQGFQFVQNFELLVALTMHKGSLMQEALLGKYFISVIIWLKWQPQSVICSVTLMFQNMSDYFFWYTVTIACSKFSEIHFKTRMKLHFSGDCRDTRRFNTLLRSFLNEYMSIAVSNSFAPYNILHYYLLDLRLKLFPFFSTNF